MLDDFIDNTSVRSQFHVHMPLNSSHTTADQLRQLGTALALTSSCSIGDQRLMVEEKIGELSQEPCNVQVVFEEYFSDAFFQLCEKDNKFLTVPSADADHSYEGDEPYRDG